MDWLTVLHWLVAAAIVLAWLGMWPLAVWHAHYCERSAAQGWGSNPTPQALPALPRLRTLHLTA